jgi:aminoglycoside 6'-N-acetyltransferase I
MKFHIRLAQRAELPELAEMRALLWPDGSVEEHRRELSSAFSGEAVSTLPTATFVAAGEDGALIGFLEASLRSHADGCDTSRPVGFVEGWFVRAAARGHGAGDALMRAAEDWARSQGCREMGSDALIDNETSIQVHQALGFEIVDRCVHFRKGL